MAMVVAVPQAPSSTAGARAQPARKARRLGSRRVRSQPGSAANDVAMYWARSGAGGFGGAGFSGSCVHAAANRIATTESSRDMWIVYLEMGFALLVAVLIVWVTWPRKKK